VAVGRIYDPPSPDDGTRVLVMRLWPRGIRKDRVDRWLRDLAPDVGLMRGFLRGEVPWEEYSRRYLAGLDRAEAQAQLAELGKLVRGGRVTLLCWCQDERRCHRTLLRDHLVGPRAARPRPRPTAGARRRATPRTPGHRS
jgi:uncharacterized protein YeaO (DUF488 family)